MSDHVGQATSSFANLFSVPSGSLVDYVLAKLEQCKGLNLRRRESLFKCFDLIYSVGKDHLNGTRWSSEMEAVFTRLLIPDYKDRSEWSYWNPMVRIGLFPEQKEFDEYHYSLISRGARACHATRKFSVLIPRVIAQPSDGIRHTQFGDGSITRFVWSYEAWKTQERNRFSSVPSANVIPPPHIPITGTYEEGCYDGEVTGREFGLEDANRDGSSSRAQFELEASGRKRFSDEYKRGWLQMYRPSYMIAFEEAMKDKAATETKTAKIEPEQGSDMVVEDVDSEPVLEGAKADITGRTDDILNGSEAVVPTPSGGLSSMSDPIIGQEFTVDAKLIWEDWLLWLATLPASGRMTYRKEGESLTLRLAT